MNSLKHIIIVTVIACFSWSSAVLAEDGGYTETLKLQGVLETNLSQWMSSRDLGYLIRSCPYYRYQTAQQLCDCVDGVGFPRQYFGDSFLELKGACSPVVNAPASGQ